MIPIIPLLLMAMPPVIAGQASLSAPASTVIRATIKSATDRGPIPYEYADGHIVFKAEIGGQQVWMMLDTGASHSIMDEALAKQLGLAIIIAPGTGYAVGGHTIPRHYVQDVSLVVPRSFAGRIPMSTLDMSKFNAAGHAIRAILGFDWLSQMAVLADKRSGELDFLLGAGPMTLRNAPPSIEPIAIRIEGDRIRTTAIVAGQTLSLTIDTGETAGLALSPAAWARVKPGNAQVFQRKVIGASGISDTVDASRLPAITMGNTKVEDVTIDVEPQEVKDGDGRIGMGILARYSFVLDPPHDQMLLIPTATPTASLPAPVVQRSQ